MTLAPLTMSDKILSKKLGQRFTHGETVWIEPDFIGIHDILGHTIADLIKTLKPASLTARSKAGIFLDHAVPPPSPLHAAIHNQLRTFARSYGIRYLYDAGTGIMHQLVLEELLVKPWDIFVASDSHTVTLGAIGSFATGMGSTDIAYALVTGKVWIRIPESRRITLEGSLNKYVTGKDVILTLLRDLGLSWANYKSLEFTGPGVENLSLSDRLTISNMSVEMGAKTGLFPVDKVVNSYYKAKGLAFRELYPDPGSWYEDEYMLDLSKVVPVIAKPHSPANVVTLPEAEGIEVDEVFIGSCTNGRVEDFEIAASIIKGNKVATRCVAIPATRKIYLELLRKGVIEILAKAGCVVTFGTCGPCWGGHFGVAGAGEVILSTSNRNFKGRMGDVSAKIYLANPAVAAATAVTGRITDPRGV